jgi:hypothetical protein
VDIDDLGTAQHVASGGENARGVRVGDRPPSRQRYFTHGAENGVTFSVADLAQLLSP